MNGQAPVNKTLSDNTLAREEFTSEYYMQKKQQEIEREELKTWGISLDPLVHVNLIHTGANFQTINCIDNAIINIFKTSIPDFIASLRTSNNLKLEIEEIATQCQVNVIDLAKLIALEALDLANYDVTYADAYYQVAALFYIEEEL